MDVHTGQGVAAAPPRQPPSRLPSDRAIRRLALRRSAVLACLATLGVHLLFLTRRLRPDEGGFAMVARHWHEGGSYLYGPQWVDRPPGLITVFAAAGHLGPYGVRITAALLAVALVAALAWGAEAVGGRPAARWAAWSGFALGSSALLGAQELNGELAAATFVAVSVGAVLRAVRSSPTRTQTLLYGVVAGAAAATAALMKQNIVDGFVFAGVLLAVGVSAARNRLAYRPGRVATASVGFLAGALVPAAATLAWASRHGGIGALAFATVGFRADAAAVMTHWSWSSPLHRLRLLLLVACLSGLLVLLVHLAVSHRGRLRRAEPLPWAVAATAAWEGAGVVAGANFWDHYLIALVPMVALAAGLGASRRQPGSRWTRRLVMVSVAVTALVSPVAAIGAVLSPSEAYTTGRWVASSARPGDTLAVPITHANVIEASGLRPVYPYSWSLPTRTLDPHLSLLTRTLDGASAPTWVVRWDGPRAWDLDPADHVGAALRLHYRLVAVVCGHPVWLHDGLRRALAPTPPVAACGPGDR